MERSPLTYQSETAALKGEITIPGDKSISHRALILSSQVSGHTNVTGLLEADDVQNTADALLHLGVSLRRTDTSWWQVDGKTVGSLKESRSVLDMGNSGTSTRLLMGLVSPYPFATIFTGDDSLIKRPMGRVTTPLEQMGAHFTARAGNLLPLTVTGTASPKAISYELPVASAQVKSAILLAGLNTPGSTTVIEPRPSRDHTENMLRYLGFEIEVQQEGDGRRIILPGKQAITGDHTIHVPADPSSAAFALVAALICPDSDITIPNVCVNPLRTGLFTSLEEMGAQITLSNEQVVAGEPVADMSARHSTLKGITVPPARAPSMIDEYIILAIAAAFAEGETVLTGLAELRVKESDRLGAIVNGLTTCKVEVKAEGDNLTIKGSRQPEGGATIETNGDHRVAMSFLVMGMASKKPVIVDDIRPITTSFPHFTDTFNTAGARMSALHPSAIKRKKSLVIAVDGPAASGKGTLARRLAEYHGLDYLDTGSLYRAVGLKLVYNDKDPLDKEAAVKAAKSIEIQDLSNPRLRQEHIGRAASIVSSYPEVRAALLDYQRKFAKQGNGAVLDGRDIGTVVCPDANFKFFITATLYTRAKRRHKELSGAGVEVVFDSVLDDLKERDQRDQKRAVAPLKPSIDAIIMDTSTLDASEVFAGACALIAKRQRHSETG